MWFRDMIRLLQQAVDNLAAIAGSLGRIEKILDGTYEPPPDDTQEKIAVLTQRLAESEERLASVIEQNTNTGR